MKRVFTVIVFIFAASTFGWAQQFTYYFPQIAVGDAWRTTIFLSNATTTMASGSITFTRSDGSAFYANWVDERGNNLTNGGNTAAFQLAPGESRKLTALADIPLTTGYATVSANASVLGNAMFTQLDGGGNMLSEAGVPMAIPLPKQAVFVDTTSGFRTGVAIGNPNNASLEVHLELLNDAGQMIASTTRTLPPGQHFALFTDELFPGAAPMVGRLQFWCTNPMVSVALRFNPASTLFTTMAPIAVAN